MYILPLIRFGDAINQTLSFLLLSYDNHIIIKDTPTIIPNQHQQPIRYAELALLDV